MHRQILLDKVRLLFECPVEWEEVTTEEELGNLLRACWVNTLALQRPFADEWQLDVFEHFTYKVDEILMDDALDDFHSKVVLNTHPTWRNKAVDSYSASFGRAAQFHCVSRDQYSKHYNTRNSESISPLRIGKLDPWVSIDMQSKMLWMALSSVTEHLIRSCSGTGKFEWARMVHDEMLPLFEGHHTRIAAAFDTRIGTAYGKPSQHGLFDLDLSTKVFHMFPITEQEFEEEVHKGHVEFENRTSK